jgi:hypothetical protein
VLYYGYHDILAKCLRTKCGNHEPQEKASYRELRVASNLAHVEAQTEKQCNMGSEEFGTCLRYEDRRLAQRALLVHAFIKP